MRHTIIIETDDRPTPDRVEAVLTRLLESQGTAAAVGDGRPSRVRVAQYHQEDLTPPCGECGAPADHCPGGRGHDYQRES